MALETDDRGHLILEIPRVQYRICALLLGLAALLCAAWAAGFADDAGLAHWFPIAALVFCATGAIGFGWWSVYGMPLEFDADRKCLVRGRRVIAGFADMDHVEIMEKRAHNFIYYRVSLRPTRSRPIVFATGRSEINASIMAAKIATAVDKPVRVVIR
jgi:hypothetical protein